MMISIVVPVYNSEKYLSACLDSIFEQTFKDFEVVCINDGSKDQSLAILESYQQKYLNQMQVITIPNGGQANARNLGIKKAKGEYITFVDSDDTVSPYLLEKLYTRLYRYDADLSICDLDRIYDEEAKDMTKGYKFDTFFTFDGVTTIYEHPEIICYLFGAPYGKLIKRDFLIGNKIEFLCNYIYEDQVFTQTLLSYNPKIVQVPEKLYNYYVHVGSTMTSKKSRVTDMFTAYDYIYKAYDEKSISKKFKKELDYLCLYHVMIGTSFRMWRSKQFSLLYSLRTCSSYVKKYNCNKKNEYLKEKGLISVLFVKLFCH